VQTGEIWSPPSTLTVMPSAFLSPRRGSGASGASDYCWSVDGVSDEPKTRPTLPQTRLRPGVRSTSSSSSDSGVADEKCIPTQQIVAHD